MFEFSPHGIKDAELWQRLYTDYITWCKTLVTTGTFTTYCDGEPVCLHNGIEITYHDYLKSN